MSSCQYQNNLEYPYSHLVLREGRGRRRGSPLGRGGWDAFVYMPPSIRIHTKKNKNVFIYIQKNIRSYIYEIKVTLCSPRIAGDGGAAPSGERRLKSVSTDCCATRLSRSDSVSAACIGVRI